MLELAIWTAMAPWWSSRRRSRDPRCDHYVSVVTAW